MPPFSGGGGGLREKEDRQWVGKFPVLPSFIAPIVGALVWVSVGGLGDDHSFFGFPLGPSSRG